MLRLLSRTASRAWLRTTPSPPVKCVSSQRCERTSLARTVASSAPAPSRRFPDAPRVGVGVCLLRAKPTEEHSANIVDCVEALLIRRSKPPNAGVWSFPGGSLNLGETLVACAERELLEETGLRMDASIFEPEPFVACDSIHRSSDGAVEWHYVIVEVCGAVARHDTPRAVPMDDAADLTWADVRTIGEMEKLGTATAPIAEYAGQCARKHGARILEMEKRNSAQSTP